jgi:hypothetical protein
MNSLEDVKENIRQLISIYLSVICQILPPASQDTTRALTEATDVRELSGSTCRSPAVVHLMWQTLLVVTDSHVVPVTSGAEIQHMLHPPQVAHAGPTSDPWAQGQLPLWGRASFVQLETPTWCAGWIAERKITSMPAT